MVFIFFLNCCSCLPCQDTSLPVLYCGSVLIRKIPATNVAPSTTLSSSSLGHFNKLARKFCISTKNQKFFSRKFRLCNNLLEPV